MIDHNKDNKDSSKKTTEPKKFSVRLPSTPFGMRVNLNKIEENVLKAWQEKDIYSELRVKNKGKPKFILHDGPPYANGHIHVGHSLNKNLKDIFVKAYNNMGYDTPFVVGWDCHGLPIEWKIEEKYKEKNLSKDEVDIPEFRQECRDFADKWVNIQKEEFKTLGIIADFDNPYITMTYKAESIIVASVLNILEKGLLYQGKKPVLWSCIEKTALAEAEVEYKDKKADTAFVAFPINKVGAAISNPNLWFQAKIVIWTTTPWTLPANQALAYGKDISYGLFHISKVSEESLVTVNERIIIANDLASKVLEELGIILYEKIDEIIGLEGFEAKHCLYNQGYNFIVPLLSGQFVTTEVGTGIVHIAPSHGEDDFYLCQKNNIIAKEIVNADGTYTDELPLFAKEHIFKVGTKVLDALNKEGTLLLIQSIIHSYPHSWRSKAPLIYLLTVQWFISLDKDNTRAKALKALENVDFYPLSGENRLRTMIKNRPDWCISRQRAWGVPLGIFIHNKTHKPLIDKEIFANIVTAFEKEGASAWFNDDPRRFLSKKYNKNDYTAINDVVDVWLDSGLTHKFVLQEREELSYPADLYLEGSDQHRGWFQSSLIMSLLLGEKPPFKKILTHGFVLDENGQKMSKSTGDAMMPNKVVKEYGADILRMWVANSNYEEDVSIGKGILVQQVEAYRKVRNTIRYLLGNLKHTHKSTPYKYLGELDKYILHNIYDLDTMFKKVFKETFQIHHFFHRLFNFMNSDLSAFYFDIKKDILYCDANTTTNFNSTMTILDILFNYLCKWLSPFIPFTIEEAYSQKYNCEIGSLFLADFPSVEKNWQNKVISHKWERIKKLRKVVNGCLEQERAKKVIGSSLEATPIIYVNNEDALIIKSIDFAMVCITSGMVVKPLEEASTENIFSLDDVENVFVQFALTKGEKCIRCWQFYEKLEEYNICSRCTIAVNENN